MGRKDTLTKKYMKDPVIFADFMNGYLYGGHEIILPEMLNEVDTNNIAVIPTTNSKPFTVHKYRDLLKQAVLMKTDTAYYLLFGIENQSKIHYAMPVRNMLYDALAYAEKIEEITEHNRREGKDEAYISGLTKEDKLVPIITVTLYWGEEPWDAPVTLKQMLEPVSAELDKYINDYDCNLFSVVDAKQLPEYKTELGELFSIMRNRTDWDKMEALTSSNDKYKNLSRITAEMIHEIANIKMPRKTRNGGYDVCKAIREMEQIYTKKGKEIGKEEGYGEGVINAKHQDIIELLEEYGPVPTTIEDKIKSVYNSVELSGLHKFAAKVSSIEEFERRLRRV